MCEVREFVKSLKRLYENHMITKAKIDELCNKNKINKDEMRFILEGRM